MTQADHIDTSKYSILPMKLVEQGAQELIGTLDERQPNISVARRARACNRRCYSINLRNS